VPQHPSQTCRNRLAAAGSGAGLGGGHWRAFLSPVEPPAILGGLRFIQNRNHLSNCYYEVL
jgi:hypothetical protein